ncbi:MAG: amino acid ABC transporter substrate-binding protein [Oscillospiraceae bacterium]|nr:amino acid ABC transporter substrate-binding protein [Oscillospiraceae bacterium]
MKKLLTMLAAFSAAAVLTACGGTSEGNTSDTAADTTAAAAEGEDNSLQKVLDSGEFILGLDATFKPMGYTDENNQIVGFDIDCAEEVCSRMGVTLVKQPINWDTKEEDLNLGKIDCIWNGMSVNPSREESMNLSDAYMKNSMVFVVNTDSGYASQADLAGKTIAVQNGSTAQEILEASDLYTGDSPITVNAIATNVEALQQLELGLVDSVFLDSVVANYEINTSGKNYSILPDGLEEEEYAIGFRKNDQALRDEVQKTLSEMKADGTLGEISTKWFGSDITTVE